MRLRRAMAAAAMLDGRRDATNGNGVYWTSAVQRNALSPVWCEGFHFVLSLPELASLTLRVHNAEASDARAIVAENTIPVTSLRLGYRAVPLRSPKTFQVFDRSAVLCHFSLVENHP